MNKPDLSAVIGNALNTKWTTRMEKIFRECGFVSCMKTESALDLIDLVEVHKPQVVVIDTTLGLQSVSVLVVHFHNNDPRPKILLVGFEAELKSIKPPDVFISKQNDQDGRSFEYWFRDAIKQLVLNL